MLTGIVEGQTRYSTDSIRELAEILQIENYQELSHTGLIEAIKTGYNDYFKNLEDNQAKLKRLDAEELS
jgi:hypothetical protein